MTFGGFIMRKLIILLLLIFLLASCTPSSEIKVPIETIEDPIETIEEPIETIEEPVETVETPVETPSNYVGYATNLLITESIMPMSQRLPQKFFTSSYTKINFIPLTKELCVTASINDKDYRNATYYLVGRKVGNNYYGEMRVQFLIPSGVGSKSYCFSNVDLLEPYEVLLTKHDLDDLNPSSTMYSVNTLTLHDQKSSMRSRVSLHSVSGLSPSIYEMGESPYIHFTTTYSDPNKIIDTAHVVLFNPFDKSIIDSQVITITEAHYEGELLKLENIRFDNLVPGLEYIIQVFVDGNDGVDDFEKVTLESYRYETGTYESVEINDVFHGLFAVITGLEVVEDEVILYYDFKNDGTMTYTDTKLPISFKVTTYTGIYPDQIEQSFALDIEKNQMVFSKELFTHGFSLTIRDERNQLNFCNYSISPNLLSLVAYENQMHEIRIINMDHDNPQAISMKVEILNSALEVVETLENVTTQFGEFNYPYENTYPKNMGFKIRITYEVESKIGIITHTEIFPLYYGE